LPAKDAGLKWLTASEAFTLDERHLRIRLMELEFERKLQEIRYENRKFTVQLISAVAAVAGVALALLASPSVGSPMAARSAAFEYLEPHY
jgi:hypothetical protein